MPNLDPATVSGPERLSLPAELPSSKSPQAAVVLPAPMYATPRHRTCQAGVAVNRPQRARHDRLDFAAVNAAALPALPALLVRWLPKGRVEGREYVARNPRRADRHLGSFKVNLRTGRWADFATGDRGGDPVSLAAYLFGLSQLEAGRRLADALGLSCRGTDHG